MAAYPTESCPACGVQVIQAASVSTGQPVLVEPEPSAVGVYHLVHRGGRPPGADKLSTARQFGRAGQLYVAHAHGRGRRR